MTGDLLLTIERRLDDRGEVILMRGELDMTTVEPLDDAISVTTAETVILELGELEFIDSAGMRLIDQAHRRLAEAGRRLLVVAPAESRAAWTFRVAGFADGFARDSLDAALLEARGSGTAR